MEGEEGSRLHIVVFPWLAFGHMLPYLGLSKSLALRGHLISYVAPPKNIQRLPKVPSEISHLIRFVPLPLPRVDGMAEGVAATSDVPLADVRYLLDATDALEEPFSAFVNGASPKPDWIIHDVFQHWIPNIGVPYLSVSMASACCPADDADDEQGPRDYTVPPPWIPFPTKVAWRSHELLKIAADAKVQFNHSGARKDYRVRLSPYRRAKVLAARSCMELEGEWLTLASQVHGKPVIPVGLLLPSAVTEREEGGEATAEIVSWLDERNERSVVYVALGSEVTISSEQLRELALGLEIAKLPFLWAVRRPFGSPIDDVGMLPEGFKERTEGFGKVVMGWVPQLRVLAHPSVGGFLTHCGWSSIIEGLQYGRPLVMLPFMGDQCLNARMVGEKGLGVEVERNEDDGSFTRNEVKKALSLIMVDEEGDAFRKKAQEMKEAFADEERQEEYLDDFVQYLLSNRNSKA